MNITSNNEKIEILALERLYEFTSNKKFHLIQNEFISDEIGKKALEINTQIKKTTGIDIFEAISDTVLLDYQKILNQYTTEYSNRIFGFEEIGDEVRLVESFTPIQPQKLQSLKIEIIDWLKPILKDISISVPTFITMCKTADVVSYVDEEISYYLVKNIHIGAKRKILFAHLTYFEKDSTFPIPKLYKGPFLRTQTGGFLSRKSLSNTLMVRMALVFDFEEFYYLGNNPIRFFLKALEVYGLKLEINGIIKKYFRKLILPVNNTPVSDFYNIIYETKDRNRVVSMFTNSRIATTIIFIYCISIETFVRDFKSGKI